MDKREISIIGTGRAGTSLAYALKKKGWRILYLCDISSSSALESKKIIGDGKVLEREEIVEKGDFFILSVPDNALETLAKEIALKNKNLKEKTFIHLSGSLSHKILAKLKERGAYIGSLHPVFPFPTKKTEIPKGVYFGWDGEKKALEKASAIVKTLKGKLVLIEKKKALYHLACSLASNFPSILYLMGLEKLKKTGLKVENAREMLFQLCYNALKSVRDKEWQGVSGPALRGDTETILAHLKNLEPQEKKIYKEILLYFLKKNPVKGADEILKVIKEK